jgi:hypothetical protein
MIGEMREILLTATLSKQRRTYPWHQDAAENVVQKT